MSNGWFKIHRSLFDNDLWTAEPFTKGQAWVDLVGNANHKPAIFWVRGVEVSVNRGQLAWSEVTMARKWKWSRNKVRRFLKLLKNNGMVEQQTGNVTTLLTICNYSTFQDNGTANDTAGGTASDTASDTAERQQAIQQTIHKQEGKELKNGKNGKNEDIYPAPLTPDAVFYVPTNKYGTQGETYPIDQPTIDQWAMIYPAADIDGEIRKIIGWSDSNPTKRKTHGGMKRFINSWLSRAQDKGHTNPMADPLTQTNDRW